MTETQARRDWRESLKRLIQAPNNIHSLTAPHEIQQTTSEETRAPHLTRPTLAHRKLLREKGPHLLRSESSRNFTMDTQQAIILHSLDGRILDWNAGAEQLFGYLRNDMLGQPLSLLVPSDALAHHEETLQSVARGEEVFLAETTRLHQGGKRIDVRGTIAPLRDQDNLLAGAITVFQDLTQARRLEQQQYRQPQKIEAFSQLAGGVAHDFNNLLTVILGYAEFLISCYDPSESMRGYLLEIHKAGLLAETLTRQLLIFNRKQVPETQILDLTEAICSTEKLLRRFIGEDILLTTIFSPNLPPVEVDPNLLQQVILTLAMNARTTMPQGGRLTIETANVTRDESYPQENPHVAAGGYVMIALGDNGIGMSDADRASLLEPSSSQAGRLSAVREIVQQSGGHLEVESHMGQGSKVKVFLPHAQGSIPAGKPHLSGRWLPQGKEVVLVVEDEESVRTLACRVLQMSGYTVLQASNGEDGLKLGLNYPGRIDLLVTDVVMPHLGGRPLAERLIGLNPHMKVLFLSGYPRDTVRNHGIQHDEFTFLQKPFTSTVLAQKVRTVLDRAY